jgi:hypothetical protein
MRPIDDELSETAIKPLGPGVVAGGFVVELQLAKAKPNTAARARWERIVLSFFISI